VRTLWLCIVLSLAIGADAAASTLAPGLYDASGKLVYVGVEHELPDPPQNEFFEPANRRTGELTSASGLRLRCGVRERRTVVDAQQVRIGASLYYGGDSPRTTVILAHGNDPESREMGFIIPYFVCNGINVISYDQRGVGESTGNWFLTGPIQKADDVAAVYDAFAGDRQVARRKIGVWGFSNGGWVAPLVTLRRPCAFMILKSAPTESLLSNIHYEVVMEMKRGHASRADIAQALKMWHTVEGALYGTTPWSEAIPEVRAAEQQPWFDHSLMLKLTAPPSPAMAEGLRRAITYDPKTTLTSITTPALALYGALDTRVDSADSARHMREYLVRGGDEDVTVKMYPHAGHPLVVTTNGYYADPPKRYVKGYPEIMLQWLDQRGY
jgi:pimeloyl-ACP methyl ester carboxylesterase